MLNFGVLVLCKLHVQIYIYESPVRQFKQLYCIMIGIQKYKFVNTMDKLWIKKRKY